MRKYLLEFGIVRRKEGVQLGEKLWRGKVCLRQTVWLHEARLRKIGCLDGDVVVDDTDKGEHGGKLGLRIGGKGF